MIPEFTRILHNGTKKYAEFYYSKGSLGAPAYEWWDLEMCQFKYKQLKDILGSEIILTAISELEC